MKIDGIALLQMIKDNKLKENTLIKVSGGIHVHLPYVIFGENKRLYWAYCKTNIQGAVLSNELIEYEFEIIEDKIKKIGEIDFMTAGTQKEKNKIMKDAINEAIKVLNYLSEKSNKDE